MAPTRPSSPLRDEARAVRAALSERFGARRDREDLVQDALVELLERTRGGNAGLRLWDAVRLSARVVAHRERRRATHWAAPTPELHSATSSTPEPEGGLDARRAISQLDGLLGRLSARERAMFVMHYIDGESEPAIAAAVGLPRRRVRRHLLLARARVFAAATQQVPWIAEYLCASAAESLVPTPMVAAHPLVPATAAPRRSRAAHQRRAA
jgi:RNA polymerase sigma factor (sigma-70 family)